MVEVFAHILQNLDKCDLAQRINQLPNRKDYLEVTFMALLFGGARTEVHLPRLMKIYVYRAAP